MKNLEGNIKKSMCFLKYLFVISCAFSRLGICFLIIISSTNLPYVFYILAPDTLNIEYCTRATQIGTKAAINQLSVICALFLKCLAYGGPETPRPEM